MNATHRILTQAGRVLLSAALMVTAILAGPPPSVRAAVGFTDLGDLGMTAAEQRDAAWGDYDGDGDLDLVVAGMVSYSNYITRVYRNDGGSFVDTNAGLPGVLSGAGETLRVYKETYGPAGEFVHTHDKYDAQAGSK